MEEVKTTEEESSYASVNVGDQTVQFASKDELVSALENKMASNTYYGYDQVDEIAEKFKSSGVDLDDVAILKAVKSGDMSALGYLTTKYKKDDIELDEYMTSDKVGSYAISPLEVNTNEIKVNRIVDKLSQVSPEAGKVLTEQVLGSWDESSVAHLTSKPQDLITLSGHIQSGVFDEVMKYYKEIEVKGDFGSSSYDIYVTAFEKLRAIRMGENEAKEIALMEESEKVEEQNVDVGIEEPAVVPPEVNEGVQNSITQLTETVTSLAQMVKDMQEAKATVKPQPEPAKPKKKPTAVAKPKKQLSRDTSSLDDPTAWGQGFLESKAQYGSDAIYDPAMRQTMNDYLKKTL